MNLEEIFNQKRTENGDIAFTKINDDNLLNILFLTEYYQNHLSEVKIGNTEKDQLFARFIRDPRFGLGRRELGRVLMHMAGCSIEDIVWMICLFTIHLIMTIASILMYLII